VSRLGRNLVINTVTNVVTFVMVFLIQYGQNRDSMAIQLKLDELLRAVVGARTGMVDFERRSDAELHRLRDEFARLGERAAGITSAPDALLPPRET
jgi:low affinity Fe/Cu permease